MKEYSIISTLVKSGNKYRIYTSQAYSIRALVVMLLRYCPAFDIMAVKYGEFECECPSWSSDYEMCDEDGLLPIKNNYSKEELLRLFDYRTAINIYYYQCSRDRKYPSKSPFKNVRPWTSDSFIYKINSHPFFARDDENEQGADILRYYDGKRIEKYINGEKIQGYYLTTPRIIEENVTENA